MDVIAHADGDIGEDAGCQPSDKSQQAKGHEVHNADVLVHRQGGEPGGGVLYAATCQVLLLPVSDGKPLPAVCSLNWMLSLRP